MSANAAFVANELRAICRRLNPDPGAPGKAEEEARVTASDLALLADILDPLGPAE